MSVMVRIVITVVVVVVAQELLVSMGLADRIRWGNLVIGAGIVFVLWILTSERLRLMQEVYRTGYRQGRRDSQEFLREVDMKEPRERSS